jgi:hypothetical protein
MRLDHLGVNANPHQRCSLIGQSGKNVTVYGRNRSVLLQNCVSPKRANEVAKTLSPHQGYISVSAL